MGKRSNFAKRKEDAYDTPKEAVLPLLPYLPPSTRFIEPCAGRGDLIGHLHDAGHICVGAFDIAPRKPLQATRLHYDPECKYYHEISKRDALKLYRGTKPTGHIGHPYKSDMIITNPPWTRGLLHKIIAHFFWQNPTWLLFDAGWQHTLQARPYLPMLQKVVSVGRVKWIEGTDAKG